MVAPFWQRWPGVPTRDLTASAGASGHPGPTSAVGSAPTSGGTGSPSHIRRPGVCRRRPAGPARGIRGGGVSSPRGQAQAPPVSEEPPQRLRGSEAQGRCPPSAVRRSTDSDPGKRVGGDPWARDGAQAHGSLRGGGGGVGTRPWWLALLACGGAYWPLAFEPSAMTSRHPHYCGGRGGVWFGLDLGLRQGGDPRPVCPYLTGLTGYPPWLSGLTAAQTADDPRTTSRR